MYWLVQEGWVFPIGYALAVLYCWLNFSGKSRQYIAGGFVMFLISTLSWRLAVYDLMPLESFSYINAFLFLGGLVMIIAGVNLVSEKKASLRPVGTGSINPGNGNVTRYLAASTLLKGSAYRRRILDYVENEHKALAPELGIDLNLVADLAKYFERRSTSHLLLFFGISFFGAILSAGVPYLAPVILIIIGLILWGGQIYKSIWERNLALELFGVNSFDAEKVRNRLKLERSRLPDTREQNLVVYDSFLPFIGCGDLLGSWSFVIDISKPKGDLIEEKKRPRNFTVKSLYDYVEKVVKSLGLDNIESRDVLFANGSDIRGKKWIQRTIYDKPVSIIDEDVLQEFVDNRDKQIRHYKWLRVYDWNYDLTVSHLLRFSKKGRNLFVEVSQFLMTPLQDQYRLIDRKRPLGFTEAIAERFVDLIKAMGTVIYSWIYVAIKVMNIPNEIFDNEERAIRKQIERDLLYNFGAKTSVRYSLSGRNYSHYFQLLDKEMHVKTVEKSILDALVLFLDAHGIDTSELSEQKTTIVNRGIIVKGGDVKAESMAVGSRAQIKKTVSNVLSPQNKS